MNTMEEDLDANCFSVTLGMELWSIANRDR